jgi:carbonic anhydrase
MPVIGTQQSPIQIDKHVSYRIYVAEQYLYPNYSGAELRGHFDFEGHNFIFDQFEHFTITSPDGAERQDWVIRKIHFHDLAEHRIKGRARARYEAHIVHTKGTSAADDPDATGPKLVLATFFHHDEKAPSRESARKLNEMLKGARDSGQSRAKGKIDTGVNPLDFLPDRDDWPF